MQATSQTAKTKSSSLVFSWGILLGNLFEHYDTALYSLLSPFIAPLFFPTHDPVTALMLAYAIIPLGMLARPVGAFAIGYMGDQFGRQLALVISLFGMAVATCLIGFIPSYESVGSLAPVLLVGGRVLQNFFAAGEITGGAIHLIENTAPHRKNLMSSVYSGSTVLGILLASALVALFGYQEWIHHWRYLYFLGSLTALCGLALRFHSFNQTWTPPNPPIAIKGLFKQLKDKKFEVIAVILAAGFSYSTYSLALVLMNGFLPLVSQLTKAQAVEINTYLLVLDVLTLPLFGMLANRISSERLMKSAALAAICLGLPLFLLLEEASWLTVIFVRSCLIVIGVAFSATFHAWSQTLISKEYRCSLIGFSYALGSQLFGGPTASLSLWIFKQTEIVSSACWYWIAIALGAYLALWALKFSKNGKKPLAN